MFVQTLLGVAGIVASYLLGSIPFAYIVTRLARGADIRKIDTGNVGAGAVFRQVGIWGGAATAIGDMAKGAAAVLIVRALGLPLPWVLGAGVAAWLGHMYPIYLKFKGGQGVATLIGIFLVLTPKAIGINLLLLGVALLLVRHLAMSIFLSSPFLPLFVWLFYSSLWLTFYALAIVLALMYRNRHGIPHLKTIRVHKPDLGSIFRRK
jgi:glycerol-3-phosphate acyltransferase PlsY